MRLSILPISFLKILTILEGYGKTNSFNYANWQNDPRPLILRLGKYNHPTTGNSLVGGVNLNYMSQSEVEDLQYYLPEILKPKNLRDRYWEGRRLLPQAFENFYRTYRSDMMDGSSDGTLLFLTPKQLSSYGKFDKATRLQARRDALKNLDQLPPDSEVEPEAPPETPQEPPELSEPPETPPEAPEKTETPPDATETPDEPEMPVPTDQIDISKEVPPPEQTLPPSLGTPPDVPPAPQQGPGPKSALKAPQSREAQAAKQLVDGLKKNPQSPQVGVTNPKPVPSGPPKQPAISKRIDQRLAAPGNDRGDNIIERPFVQDPKRGSGPVPNKPGEKPDDEAGAPIPADQR